ncbi:MAG TPA: tripartite tricarboxylate transporter TctB family protein [Gammaproteobacteria bacterium]|nr:tripartite tricarboxylate transporter TctB family protein [Gammaproteobacteria bacterium]
MTVRTAELLMAIIMGVFSVYLMWKSAELEIGWVHGEGPGGGAWPFWLSAGMLICCVATMVRWFTRTTPQSRSSEYFMDRKTWQMFTITAGSLAVTLALVHVIGMYFALILFLLFYFRVVGAHTWKVVFSLSLLLPAGTFFFFEGLLKIILPKGYSEPLFYPLYRLIY